MILDRMKSETVKTLNISEKEKLAKEIRRFLVENVSKTGGHLASNLGAVELTIALHSVFDPYTDRIVFDVGHQSYTHKILTGRMDKFDTLRQFGGISGFPKTQESDADAFNTGHSSTSVSAALGFAEAARLSGEQYHSIAVIGDGALSGGMAFEALNQAGNNRTPLIVVLNDNGMSISQNVGALAKRLKRVRNANKYFNLKEDVKTVFDNIPVVGEATKRIAGSFKNGLKRVFVPGSFFESFGFKYLGPVDGHNISELITVLEYAKTLDEPVLMHTVTKKGKGYAPAEKEPNLYHGVGVFDPKIGINKDEKKPRTWAGVFGDTLCELSAKNKNIVAITAAMPDSTGLSEFAKLYPKRFFDVGIAEQNAVTFGAGLASSGLTPVFAVYSTFLQRAYDQILHDVALQNLHMVFCVDHCGLSGDDGETHHGVYDIAFLSHMPSLKILSPSNEADFKEMLDFAINELSGPVAVRYPKGNITDAYKPEEMTSPLNGRVLSNGDDILIIGVGTMCEQALKAKEILDAENISASVIDLRAVKPMDAELIKEYALSAKVVAAVEDGVVIGGVGERISALLGRDVLKFGYPDAPVIQGKNSEIMKYYGIDADGIAREIAKAYEEHKLWQNND